jgi:acylphosphatase
MTSAHEDDRVRLHAVVYGLVQGVNFRANTQREAVQNGLTGWVANRPDGTVEVVAEGARSRIQAFERYLYRGPRLAEVERVVSTYDRASGEFGGFNIRY